MSSTSTIQKILARPKSSMPSNLERVSLPDLNVNAKPFFPPGEKERIKKIKLAKIKENKYYDHLEKVWWEQNKKMFEDSLNDSNLLRLFAKQEIKLKPMTVIQEVQSATSWVDIVKK
jgi:hypothetical protein